MDLFSSRDAGHDDRDTSRDPGRTLQGPAAHLDRPIVLRILEVVSGETDPDRVMTSVVRLALEYAGAERGLLNLQRGDAFQIEAEGVASGEGLRVRLRQSAVTAEELPASIVQDTLRTREPVLLDDPSPDRPFSEDEYVRRHGPRSALCLPLLKQGTLVGLFYLENKLVAGAFTPARIAVLELLASIAAVSLENARLNRDLRERESRLVIDALPGLVGLLTATGDVEVVNRQLLEYFGQTLEELRQWGTNGTVHPEDLPHVADVFTRSIGTGTPYNIRERFRRSDGVYRWFENRGLPLRDAAGRIRRWCVLLTDVDERTRAEEALAASERNLKLTIDTMPALAWSTAADGSADFFNQHYLEFVGLTAEQASGWGWTTALHPEDLNGLAATWQRILVSGEPGEAEARLRRHDGEYRWFLFRANPLRDETGRIVKWFGVNTDIEDRRRAETELRRAYDSFADAQRLSHTGSFITDLVGDDHNWSEETYRIFEFDPATDVTVQKIRDRQAVRCLLHDQERRHGYRSFGQPLDHRTTSWPLLGRAERRARCHVRLLASMHSTERHLKGRSYRAIQRSITRR